MYGRGVTESIAKSKMELLSRILFQSSLLGVEVVLDPPQRDQLLIFEFFIFIKLLLFWFGLG